MAEVGTPGIVLDFAKAVLERGGTFEGLGIRVRIPPPRSEPDEVERDKPQTKEERMREMLRDPEER